MDEKEDIEARDVVEEQRYESSHLEPIQAEWYYGIKMEGFTPGSDSEAEIKARRLLNYLKQMFGDDPALQRKGAVHTPYIVWNRGRADDDWCFIMVTASLHKLESFAQEDLLPMRVRAHLGAGYQPFTLARKQQNVFSHPLQLVTQKLITQLMDTDEDNEDGVCHTVQDGGAECGCNLFVKYQRQLMVRKRLEKILARMSGETKGNGIDNAIKAGVAKAVFPMHMVNDPSDPEHKNYPSRQQFLRANCAVWNAWLTPWSFTTKSRRFISWIRDYFGEKIGMYFGFLHFNCTAMLFLAIPGTALAVFQYSDRTDNAGVLIYAAMVAFWATFYLEFWKRKQATWASRWDTLSFEEEERELDEFAAGREKAYGFYEKAGAWVDLDPFARKKMDEDPASEEFIPKHARDNIPSFFRRVQYALSLTLIFTLTAGVIAATLGLLVFKLIVSSDLGSLGGGILGGIVNAISIFILDKVFFKVAIVLNDWEKHRTTTLYEDSLILKVFFFQFVNAYTSLFYIAFWKGVQTDSTLLGQSDPCLDDDCVAELSTQLTTIFITRLIIGNIAELGVPYVSAKLKLYLSARDSQGDAALRSPTRIEKEASQTQYGNNEVPGTFFDYSELAIQFGYVVLFAPAFPLAPLLAVASNTVENATDSVKLILDTQKPTPQGTADIGTWYGIFRFLAFLAVLTNALLVSFTSDQLSVLFDTDPSDFERLVIVIVAEHTILLSQFLLAWLIPDEPAWLRQQIAKTRAIQKIESEFQESKRLGARVSIHEVLVDLPDEELLSEPVFFEGDRYRKQPRNSVQRTSPGYGDGGDDDGGAIELDGDGDGDGDGYYGGDAGDRDSEV